MLSVGTCPSDGQLWRRIGEISADGKIICSSIIISAFLHTHWEGPEREELVLVASVAVRCPHPRSCLTP